MDPRDPKRDEEPRPDDALVVDELALVRAGISAVLHERGIDVSGATRSARDAASLATLDRPTLVVCGAPADLTIEDAVRRLVALRPRPVVVALLPAAHDHLVAYLVAMGASVGLRAGEPDALGDLVDAALKGGTHVVPGLHGALRGSVKLQPLDEREAELLTSELLTGREREVLVLLGEGRTNREIATALSVTLATVKSHLVRIYAKLDASNRNEALGRAVSLGLLR